MTAYEKATDAPSGEVTQTTTYPDGGKRIETYFRDGTLKKVTGSAVQPVRYDYGIDTSGPDQNRRYVKEIKLKVSDLSDTSEWTKTYTDAAGRAYKTTYPDSASQQSFYNSKGQLWKEQDPDGVITLYAFNTKGESEFTITAVSGTARTISYQSLRDGLTAGTFQSASSPDRITQVQKTVVPASGSVPDLVRVDTLVWKDNQAAGSIISRAETSTDGTKSWQTVWRSAGSDATKAVTQSVIVYDRPNRKRTTTVTAADGTQTVSVYQDGRLASVAHTDNTSSHNVVTSATYDYNEHGLQKTVTDSRNGATSYAYNNADLVYTVTTPAPASGRSAQTTTSFYNKMLHLTNVVYPDNTGLTNWYEQTGLLSMSAGSRAYPVGYTYDYAGRMKTMKTWRNSADQNSAAITTWNYDGQRGWLLSKQYANPLDGTAGTVGVDYTYTPGGRLWTRTWARTGTGGARIVTTYGYGLSAGSWHGDLMSVQYANDPAVTPSTTYSYDRLGRRSQAVRNGITSNLSYDDVGEPLSESFTGGTLNGFSVSATYNNNLQRDSLSLGGLSGYSVSYGYDNAGRLSTVSQGGSVATYGYIDKSALVGQIGFAHNSITRMTTTKQADFINRPQSVSSSAGATLSYNYGYNDANQRTNVTLADNSYWAYTYDNLGQVTSGKKFWSDRTPVAGQQFEYVFDQIGNRTSAKTGGDASGANLHAQTYTPDFLNRYSSRTVPGYAQMLGTANASANVTLWTAGPTYVQTSRKGDYFWGELQVNSGVNPVYAGMTNIALLKDGSNPDILTKSAGNVFVPGSTENFGYDSDGNLTSDSRWNYTWDAENRLIKVESLASAPTGSKRRLEFAYDYQGRRIWERITNLDTSAATEQRFLYDGWNLVAAVNGSTASILESFVWGLDLSGSPQGAGGVGGLLKVTYNGAQTTNAFVACDGNGNVCGLADAANGSIIGQYEYGPFGEVIRATGPMAKANPFRFSTQYQDEETDLLCYAFRYYTPSTGRWLSRDPADQMKGANSYLFVKNNTISHYDILGLWNSDVHKGRTMQWAGQLGISSGTANAIGVADDDIDKLFDPTVITDANFSWHFNRSTSGDSRLAHRDQMLRAAKQLCTAPVDSASQAAVFLGYGLHPLQDWVAHGDFNTKRRAPSLTGAGVDTRYYWHNYAAGGFWTAKQVDDPTLDAPGGPDGRATEYVMNWFTLSNGDLVGWTGFQPGSLRINLTEKITKQMLSEFQAYVRDHGKPCGECRKAFLGGN